MRHLTSAITVITVFAITVSGIFALPQTQYRVLPNDHKVLSNTQDAEAANLEQAPLLGTGCPDGWDTSFSLSGASNSVRAMATDGAGNVYVAGAFTAIGNVAAVGIAKWDGTSWSALGSGLGSTPGFPVSGDDIAISGSDIYVAGQFSLAGGAPARNIAKWNGSSWSALGPGLGAAGNDFITTIAVSGSNVYAGGHFSDPGNLNGVARWDGTSWSSLGTGTSGVNAIAVSGSDVYIGGTFTTVDGVNASKFAKWNGTSWSANPPPTFQNVDSIATSGSDVYIGTSSAVLKWNGAVWSTFASISGGTTSVNEILISGTDVYIGGAFANVGGSPANRIAKWDGTQWTSFGTGVGSQFPNGVSAIAVSGGTVLAGGSFTTAGGNPARNIAMWNGSAWSGFTGTALNGNVRAIGVQGADVYVGGDFTEAGALTVNRIAKWNSVTNTWSNLGSGISTNFSVNAIAVAGNKVYVGGSFGNVSGVSVSNIAVWNGSTWSALGGGVNGIVYAITVRGDEVFVGGSFESAGGQPAHSIAKWNGTTWSGLNSGIIPSDVGSIVTSGNDIYVGVAYTTLDGPNYFLKYDGTTWTPLGAGMTNGAVSGLVVDGTDVFVSGGFNSVGGTPAARIAKWNGSIWTALGAGVPGNSGGFRIAKSGSEIIAVGDFRTTQGAPFDYVAKWNGSAWTPLGTGLGSAGSALTVAGGDVFVGGGFTRAGCNLSPYFARWRATHWTGSTNTDWHTTSNWGGGSVPASGAGVTITASDVAITSADVTLSNLIVASGRTVTIGSGRTLTVNGRLELSGGTIVGPGNLVVKELDVANGSTVTGLNTLTVNEQLYLGGMITGGPVTVNACRAGAISGQSASAYIASTLTRCVTSTGVFAFPVGAGSVYAPVELSNVVGSSTFTVDPKSGAYSGAASGLPANRLQRWWELTNGGITQADLTFSYASADIVGVESRYRAYRISGGVATQIAGSVNVAGNRVVATGVTSFSPWTLAEGTPAMSTMVGRVITASGRGGRSVLVSLTDDQGAIRYAVTNPFGYYKFPNVLTFKPYTVEVRTKEYTFPAPIRVVEFDDLTPSVNFTASDH